MENSGNKWGKYQKQNETNETNRVIPFFLHYHMQTLTKSPTNASIQSDLWERASFILQYRLYTDICVCSHLYS